MPGRLFLTRSVGDIARVAGVAAPEVEDAPRVNISPGQEIWVLTASGLERMRWGLIPQGRVNARGRPVMETIVNARSETVFDKSAFEGVSRAAVPADGWYEWTGKARRKTAHRIAAADGALLWFAAIFDVWTAPGGREVPQVATVTCPPNADVAPIHDRMGVLLRAEDLTLWLTGSKEQAAPLMVPWPEGALSITDADGVDWSGP